MQDNEDGLFYKIFLRKWHPQPTITCAMVIFLSVGLIFIVLGSVIMAINASIVEHHIANYDKLGNCKENGYNKEC